MKKKSKRYRGISKSKNDNKKLGIKEVLDLIKNNCNSKFDS